jgi:flavodoxin
MEVSMNKKNLVLYFSAYGTSKKTAAEIAKQTGADLVEIERDYRWK